MVDRYYWVTIIFQRMIWHNYYYSLQNSLLIRMKLENQLGIRRPCQPFNDQNIPPNIPSHHVPSCPPLKIAPIDKPEAEGYRSDIESFVLSLSQAPCLPVNYFHLQPDLSQHMRGVLLSWLQEVHQKYKLMPETFFLNVKIIDAFLKIESVPRNKLQLVGVTAMWIAAKYQETYQVPKLSNLEHICDKTYKAPDILQMEGRILSAIGFGILVEPSPLAHLELLKHHAQLQPRDYWLARYLLDASLFDLSLQRFSPALLAFSIIFFLKKMRGYEAFEQKKLKSAIGGGQQQIRTIGRQLCALWHKANQQDCLAPLRSKYSSKQYSQVSKIRLQERSK